MDAPAAIAACREAVAQQPQVARFIISSLGRSTFGRFKIEACNLQSTNLGVGGSNPSRRANKINEFSELTDA